jgi:HEAT repeat protein
MIKESNLKEISLILAELLKIIKVVSVYPENNPIPSKLKESFCGRFVDLVRDLGPLTFKISRNEIHINEDLVFKDDGNEKSLANLLFRAGINRITFTLRFDYEECFAFIDIMTTFFRKGEESDDLVALLWEADLAGLEYSTLEDVLLKEYDAQVVLQASLEDGESYVKTPDDGNCEPGTYPYADIFSADILDSGIAENEVEAEQLAENRMGLDPVVGEKDASFIDSARIMKDAFSMETEDMEKALEIIQNDAEFDMYQATGDLLIEILQHQSEYNGFDETVIIIERTIAEFLKADRITYAGNLLKALKQYSLDIDPSQSNYQERIAECLTMAGGREKLAIMAQSLNNNETISYTELFEYLSIFGWKSLLAITDLLGELEHKEHRIAVCDYLAGTDRKHVDIIARAVFDKQWYVVRNAAGILARIGGEKAFGYLNKAIAHQDSRVRIEIVEKLSENSSGETIRFLARLIWDYEEDVSRAAIQAILKSDNEIGVSVIHDIITDERFASLNEKTQESIILAYSKMGGEKAVNNLIKLIAKTGLWLTQAKEFRARTVIRALSMNKSEKAITALKKLSKSWRKKIRSFAREALSARQRLQDRNQL